MFRRRPAYNLSATIPINRLAGTRSSCATRVPANRLPTSPTRVRRKVDSSTLPSMTSSVIMETWGSMKTNIKMVATPLTMAERVLAVTRNSGCKYPA